MIQFTKLRLQGFKSFVDPTELLIEPGMTGVVGPNGCGKSNLVEALRWVMGETSAKQMRGGEMDDVIFGGTSQRPARNHAEVTVVLDNSRRTAPALFNDFPDLEITRRIDRGEGSLYRCNGKEVRAKDVMLLFADAATGARSTAMVSQGRVGALINAKPAQRRSLLEEAAGIGGLHTRRHEAELRLRAAETNLERLQDVLSALDTQLGSLRRQARQAQRYRALSENIRLTEALLLSLRWVEAMRRLEAGRVGLVEAESAVARLTGAAAEASRLQALAAAALAPLREAEAAAAAGLHRLVVAREQLDAEERRLDDQRRAAETRLRQTAEDAEREADRAHDAEAALARLAEEAETIALAQADEAEQEMEAAERVEALSLAVEEAEEDLTRLTQRLAEQEAGRASAQRQRAEAQVRAERLGRRLEEAEQALAATRAEAGDSAMVAEAAARLEDAAYALVEARAAVEAAEEAEADGRILYDDAREEVQALAAARARLRAEAEALTALLAEMPGSGDWPPVLDSLTVAPGMETALGAALGDDLAAALDTFAPAHWLVLPVQGPVRDEAAAPLPPGVPALAESVAAPPPVRAALARRLAQVGVVADRATGDALRHELFPGQRLVSRAGDLWRWDGFTVRAGAPSPAATRLAQRNRLKELLDAAAEADQTVAEAEAEAQRHRDAIDHAAAALASGRLAVKEAEKAEKTAREEHAALSRRAAAAESRLAALTTQAEALAADLVEARAAAEEAAARLDDLATDGAERLEVERRRAEQADRRTRLAEARSALDRVRRDAADRRRRLDQVTADRDGWRQRLDASAAQRQELARRHQEVAEELHLLAERPAEIAEQRLILLEKIDDAETARAEAADALAAAEATQAEADRGLREAERAAATAREDRVRAEAALTQAEDLVRAIAGAINERLGCTPDQARAAAGLAEMAPAEVPAIADLEERLTRLNREREAMGPVNLRAEQEAEELDGQLSTLASEREDLLAAIARLRQGINEINREGRQRLLASFEKVDAHFRRLFTRLFGGGRAHLALTESDDPLDAGLEIYASPPGKRLQVLSLLSGGEQAMTAIALLFAVFLVNPAPICVLDEVDAPLDDANVDRFCTLLGELTRLAEAAALETGVGYGTRFLVVTHHRMTMARMDRLYGVTMAERGVSKLVSVDLREAERLRDAPAVAAATTA